MKNRNLNIFGSRMINAWKTEWMRASGNLFEFLIWLFIFWIHLSSPLLYHSLHGADDFFPRANEMWPNHNNRTITQLFLLFYLLSLRAIDSGGVYVMSDSLGVQLKIRENISWVGSSQLFDLFDFFGLIYDFVFRGFSFKFKSWHRLLDIRIHLNNNFCCIVIFIKYIEVALTQSSEWKLETSNGMAVPMIARINQRSKLVSFDMDNNILWWGGGRRGWWYWLHSCLLCANDWIEMEDHNACIRIGGKSIAN